MIIKKLAVPLINEKILSQAEHCYIATAANTEAAFDFVRSRLSPKCKIDIVTGLDELTSPSVLKRIWRNYQDRITFKIYTRNFFHANTYVFDLPFRKSVAFLGSGTLTMGGLKDHEEIFYKITDPKQIESVMSWYTSYYEFSEPLTENMIQEYELIYHSMRQREIASREEKEQMIAITTRGFNWEAIRFKNQFFKKEDYLVFSNTKASQNSPTVQEERVNVQHKLLQLHESVKKHLAKSGLHAGANPVSSLDPADHPDHKLRNMRLHYGRKEAELIRSFAEAKVEDFMNLQVVIQQKEVGVWLMIGKPVGSEAERELFKKRMEEADYRNTFFTTIQSLGAGYWIEVAGEKRAIETFQTEDALWEFTKGDEWRYYRFVIGKNYGVGSPELDNDTIPLTIEKESDKLILLYRHLNTESR